MLATRYSVCAPHVIHETIDGEVVIINLESGNYYSLRGSGARIWEGIAGGADIDAIGDDLLGAFDGLDGRPDVSAFLEELEREGLISRTADDARGAGPLPLPIDGPRAAYAAPVLEGFTDMQDLILLDPVHEVDEAYGWPRPKPAE